MNYYDLPCTNPWWNMAFDEWLLQCGPSEPVFRLWRNEPSVIIGHNQVAAQEVNLEYLRQNGIKLARRVTGGGAVYHDLQNLNYTFAGPLVAVEEAPSEGRATRGTEAGGPPRRGGGVSPQGELPKGEASSAAPSDLPGACASGAPNGAAIFATALRTLGLPAELTGRNDIFVEGRKISGYARSVWHNRELVHGTLMYDVDIDTLTEVLNVEGSSKLNLKGVSSIRSRVTNVRDYLPQFASLDELQAKLQSLLSKELGTPLQLTKSQLAEIDKLASEKFASSDWIYKQ